MSSRKRTTRRPTASQQRKAIAKLQLQGAAFKAPANSLVRPHPARTIEACRQVLALLVTHVSPAHAPAGSRLHDLLDDALCQAQMTLDAYGAVPGLKS